MKKLFFCLAVTTLSLSGYAQENSKKEVRDQARAQRQEQLSAAIDQAIQSHNFTFVATEMIPEFRGPAFNLDPTDSFVEVYPNTLDVQLPYRSVAQHSTQIPPLLAMETTVYTSWEADENEKGNWTIVFQTEWRGVKYTFHLRYAGKNGAATLTLMPSRGDSMTYTGTIQPH